MKLYFRKLTSTEELQKEKKKVNAMLKLLEKEEAISMKNIIEKVPKAKAGGNSSVLSTALDFIPFSHPLLDIAVKIVKRRLDRPKTVKIKNANLAEIEVAPLTKAQKTKNAFKTVAIDVVTGYLKWKAVELGFKGIKYLIRGRQQIPTLGE